MIEQLKKILDANRIKYEEHEKYFSVSPHSGDELFARFENDEIILTGVFKKYKLREKVENLEEIIFRALREIGKVPLPKLE